jgi:two-component system OmpR family response regulator
VAKNLPSVFVVDDEKTIAETLVTILHLSGFAAKSFTDPREALSAALDDAPDLLLSDVMMPELSGWSARSFVPLEELVYRSG